MLEEIKKLENGKIISEKTEEMKKRDRLVDKNKNFLSKFYKISNLIDHPIFEKYNQALNDKKLFSQIVNISKVNFPTGTNHQSLTKLYEEWKKWNGIVNLEDFCKGLSDFGNSYLTIHLPLLNYDRDINFSAISLIGEDTIEIIKFLKDSGLSSKKINNIISLI